MYSNILAPQLVVGGLEAAITAVLLEQASLPLSLGQSVHDAYMTVATAREEHVSRLG